MLQFAVQFWHKRALKKHFKDVCVGLGKAAVYEGRGTKHEFIWGEGRGGGVPIHSSEESVHPPAARQTTNRPLL